MKRNETTSAKDTTMKTTIEMRAELAFHAKMAKKAYEDAQTKFITNFSSNPVSTISWEAEDMVKAQAAYEVWMRIDLAIAEHHPAEVLRVNLEDMQYRVRSFFGSNSTSIFSNAVERAKAEASLKLAETLAGLAKHFGI